jgi:hypothetical protein
MAATGAKKKTVEPFQPMKRDFRPLETAPKDGTRVRLFVEGCFGAYDLPFPCHFWNGVWVSTEHRCPVKDKPMGWMPW